MSRATAYELRQRPDAASFRQAWDAAIEFGISRLDDAALGRALNGVAVPIFYKGEQVGERRVFNKGLTKFLLRYRRPDRYGRWMDAMSARERHPDGPGIRLGEAVRRLAADGAADRAGQPRPVHRPLRATLLTDDPEEMAAREREVEARDQATREAEFQRYLDTLDGKAGNRSSGVSGGDGL